MNKLQHIYANGCSFTHDNYIINNLKQHCYPELLAKSLGLACTNAGVPGSCNRRIIRNTLRDCLTFDSSTMVIVQLTFLSRTEKPFTPGQGNEWKLQGTTEEYHESIKGNTSESLNQEYYRNYLRFFDERAELTNLAADLIMLSGYLNSKNIPYFIFPYVQLGTDPAVCIQHDLLQKTLSQDEYVLDILKDSLIDRLGPGDWYYDSYPGHLNAQGHRLAAELLQTLIPIVYVEPK